MRPLALLRLECDTHWLTDDRGRLLRNRTAEDRPAPLLAVATTGADLVWAFGASLPDELIARILPLLVGEPSGAAEVGWEPTTAAEMRELVGEAGPTGEVQIGPCFLADDRPPVPTDVDLRTSAEVDLAAIAPLLPARDRLLTPPWAIALVDGEIAAVCETARDAPTAASAGVWTYEAHRRTGLASAVTAAWIGLLGDRTAFYGTTADNLASRGVARRLGLRPLGQWWWIDA